MAENGLRVDGDFTNGHNEHSTDSGKARLNEAAQKYIQELMAERARMETHFPLAVKLVDEALERVQLNGRIPTREQYADVYQQRTIKLSQKVHVPIKDKKFNYVGKLLGPKGNSLRRLQEETQCKIVILGRFSMKDRVREEELRNSADAKYAHLNLPLHVEVSTIAPPAEAYARVAYALAEIRRYLIPDKHDDIRQEQFRELMEDPEVAKKISIRQQQQQQQQQGGIHHGNGGGNSNNPNHRSGASAGTYRPKYQPQSQNYHHNDETVHYRSHNNNFHQTKPYVAAQRSSGAIHSTLPQQGMVNAPSTGMVVSNPNFSGRSTGMGSVIMTNNTVANVGGGGGGGNAPNLRYRAPLPYQYVKK